MSEVFSKLSDTFSHPFSPACLIHMMTFVLDVPGSSALQSLQLGANEIASSLVIGKAIGSISSRHEDARIFDALESKFEVRVCDLPVGLQQVTDMLPHSSLVLGKGTGQIRGSQVMGDVNINQPQGLATFVVLCTRFVASKMTS